LKTELIVALDYSTEEAALKTVDELKDVVSIFKVGMELFYSCGPQILDKIHARGCRVFLDLKFHDIPNTVAGAVRSVTRKGVFMLSLQIPGGTEMIRRACETAEQEAAAHNIPRPRMVGITVLTSIDQDTLERELGIKGTVKDKVLEWSVLGQKAGLDGVVASPKEILTIRKTCGENYLIVTPGIRPTWAACNDQKRVMTPAEATARGADYIVVGRPITLAQNPKDAAYKIIQEMEEGKNNE